jgi:hypothetical protein
MKLEYYRGGYDSFRTLFAAHMVHLINPQQTMARTLNMLQSPSHLAT